MEVSLQFLGPKEDYDDLAKEVTHCPAYTGGTSDHSPGRARRCSIVRRRSRTWPEGVSVAKLLVRKGGQERTGHSCGPARSRCRSGRVVSRRFRWKRAEERQTHAEIILTVDGGQRGRVHTVEQQTKTEARSL